MINFGFISGHKVANIGKDECISWLFPHGNLAGSYFPWQNCLGLLKGNVGESTVLSLSWNLSKVKMVETRIFCSVSFILSDFYPFSWHLKFLKSEFRGLLPKPYESGPDGTKVIPSQMNDMNREEPSRYVSLQDNIYYYHIRL